MTADTIQTVQSDFDARAFERSHAGALLLLRANQDDLQALWLAARSSLALERDDAGTYLRRIVRLRPSDPEGWRELAHAAEDAGDLKEAASAFRELLRLQPDDMRALLDLGHTLYALGDTREAVAALAQVVGREPSNIGAMRSLGSIYQRQGDPRAALRMATAIVEWQPFNVLALMDVAMLNQELGDLGEAARAYETLRSADLDAGHEVYASHGLIRIEILRRNWRRALELAIDATRLDRDDLTTMALAVIAKQALGQGDTPGMTLEELDAAFAAEAAEHRRMHGEALPA